MPEQTANSRSGFFHRVITSANAGLPSEPVKPDAFRSGYHFTEPSAWGAIDSEPSMQNESMRGCNPAVEALDYVENAAFTQPSVNRQKAWRGEEGPLSGAGPGSKEPVDHLGDSTISRSDPKAVGSASKSSYDTPVKGIEHTEVDHASGHVVSSSSVRIESGVLKTPESNQVLLSGSKVERYAEAKDWRQQAASSSSYLDGGNGPSGPDDDRAGLPPTSPPEIKPAAGPTPRHTASMAPAPQGRGIQNQPAESAGIHRSGAKKSGDEDGMAFERSADDGALANRRTISGGRDNAQFNSGQRLGIQPADGSDAVSLTSGNSDRANAHDHESRRLQIIQKNKDLPGRPQTPRDHRLHPAITSAHETGANADAFEVKKAASGPQNPEFINGNPPAVPAADKISDLNAGPHPKSGDALPAKASAGAAAYLPRLASPPQSPFRDQSHLLSSATHFEPKVQIGQIDVILEAPQMTPRPVQPSTPGSTNMASRYYLKGL